MSYQIPRNTFISSCAAQFTGGDPISLITVSRDGTHVRRAMNWYAFENPRDASEYYDRLIEKMCKELDRILGEDLAG